MDSQKSPRTTCSCDECFYCYINQKFFHTNNLEQLKSAPLVINVAEYVGPEVTASLEEKPKSRLENIPIKICSSGQ